MDQKPLGRTGCTISAIGLGCVTFGREIDEPTSIQIMDYALEKGLTFFDTAEAYGGGQSKLGRQQQLGVVDQREVTTEISSSERIIGDWIASRGCRDQVTLCTKVSTGGSRENVHQALDASLKRLKTDYVDILKMHSYDADTPMFETLEALNAEVGTGRVRAIGCSNYSANQLQEALDVSAAHGFARFEITQPPYSLVDKQAESDLFPLCAREGIAVTPYSPLAAGFLAGKYTPDRSQVPKGTRFDIAPSHIDIYFNQENFRIVKRLREKANQLDTPMVRLAMAWAMTHPDVTSVIIGARTTGHIDNALSVYETGLDPALRTEMSSWK